MQVALTQFVEHGYDATSVRTIAKEVGVTVPALYYHFENKQAMLTALLSHTMDILESHVAEALDDAGEDPRDRFCAVVEAIVLHLTHHRDLAFLDREIRSLTPENRREYAARRAVVAEALIECVERGCASGEFATPLPRESGRAILGMCLAITTWFRMDGPLTASDVARQYVTIALDTVRATPEAEAGGAH
nr:TetR/AcrR family transcriptional regulator [Microbacterium thalassium]